MKKVGDYIMYWVGGVVPSYMMMSVNMHNEVMLEIIKAVISIVSGCVSSLIIYYLKEKGMRRKRKVVSRKS